MLAAMAATLTLGGLGTTGAAAATSAPWAPVDARLQSIITSGDATGLSLRVMTGGRTVYNKAFGTDWTTNTFVPAWSTTKMATATAIMALVDRRKLKLSTRVTAVLPWFDDSDPGKARVTLGQLLAHTSGLPGIFGNAPCIGDAATTMDACGRQIAGLTRIGTPGTVFAYSGSDLQVAALMAQTVSKQPWTAFFSNALIKPCRLNWQWNSQTNPRVAAGGSTDPASVMKILQIQESGGFCGRRRILSEAAVTAMQADHQRGTTINYTPYPGRSHGLGEWRDRVSRGRAWIVSSPGVGGTYPWVDLRHGYRAYLNVAGNPISPATYQWSAKAASDLFKLVPAALKGGRR